jgi:hypothetical protein
VTDSAAASIEAKLAEFSARLDTLAAKRNQYRELYLQTLELCRKLELGIVGQKRERQSGRDAQLTMGMRQMLLGEGRPATPAAPPAPATETKVAADVFTAPYSQSAVTTMNVNTSGCYVEAAARRRQASDPP